MRNVTENIGGINQAAQSTSDRTAQLRIAADELSRRAAALSLAVDQFLVAIRA